MERPAHRPLATWILATLLFGASIARLSAESGAPPATGADLAKVSDTIRANYRSVRAMVVLHNDLPAFEYYREGTSPNHLLPVHSVTKSVISTLVGIALSQGAISSLDQRLGDLLPEAREPGVDPRVREITIRHLLTMSSGFEPNSMGTLPPSGQLWAWSLHRPMLDAPGQRFNYDSEACDLLPIVLTRATKQDLTHFAQVHLFGPLGIENYDWLHDGDGYLKGSTGLSLTAWDMAKFGALYLRGGRWKGQQLVSKEYVADATRAHNQGGRPVVRADYGYLWWITRPPGEPAAYFAAGVNGQLIYVVPAHDVVVVVAGDASGAGGRDLINRAVLPALESRVAP